jgi:hypothetical protein
MRSTLGHHRWIGVVGVLLLASSRTWGAAPPQLAPWLLQENADKYVFLGKQVWEIDSGKMVSQTGAPDVSGTTRWIAGVTDRLFDAPPAGYHPAGITAPGRIVMLDGSPPQMPTLDGKMEQDSGNGPPFWTSTDHRRVVWMERGDYWRGEIDWATMKVVNRKQVTSLGAFTPMNRPFLWWGHLLMVWGGFDKEKPIVRINLATGDVTEMETYRAMQVNLQGGPSVSMVSPTAARIFVPTESVLFCYDVRTGKPTMFRNKFENLTIGRSRAILFIPGTPPIWTDDETVYSADNAGYLARLDFRNSRMDILGTPPRIEGQVWTKTVARVPGTHLLDMAPLPNSSGKTAAPTLEPGKRFLWDVTTDKRTPLPFDENAMGTWVDSTTYLYVLTKGGLSTVGTWVYDRTSNATKRLSANAVDLSRTVYLPTHKQAWAVSQQSGGNLIRLHLDGAPSENLGSCGLSIPQKMPPVENAIDLGFTKEPKDLWQPVKVDEAALAATQPPEPPAGKLKLFDLTRDESADNKKFAESAYDYCLMNAALNPTTDPVKFAMKVLDMHRGDPNAPINNLIFQKDFSDCIDRDRLGGYGHDQALAMMRSDTKLSPEQKEKIADRTGQLLADAVAKQARSDVRNTDSLLRDAYAKARKEVTGESGPPTPGTPARGTQQSDSQQADSHQQNQQQQQSSSQQQNQQQQKNQQQPSSADKAANEAQKAKNTANKLRGIFRH